MLMGGYVQNQLLTVEEKQGSDGKSTRSFTGAPEENYMI